MRSIIHLLNRICTVGLIVLLSAGAFAQTAEAPSGAGTEGDPYLIANLDNLYWITQNSGEWSAYYEQTADIDASGTSTWDSGNGFTPIGNSSTNFTGQYNGKGYAIDGIYIDGGSSFYIGIFGYIESARIDSLAATNVDITGGGGVGSIAGWVSNGTVSSCYATGSINASNSGSGGLVGILFGNLNNCYSKASVTTSDSDCGGLVGNNQGTIDTCYSTGSVPGDASSIGGLVGTNNGTVNNSFWDTETSGQTSSQGGTGKTTAQMKNAQTFIDAGWDFMDETANGTEDHWGDNDTDNEGYPFLQWQGYSNVPPGCDAPTETVTDIVLGSVTDNSINLTSYTEPINYADGYAIYINTANSWTPPTDGSTPSANTSWQGGGQQCIYFGNSTTPDVTVTSLLNNTTYYFIVYAYNDCGGTTWETTGADTSQTTLLTYTVPAGSGTEVDPYQIATLDNLSWLMQNDTVWSDYFIQTADIDASTTSTWFGGAGFIPIGNFDVSFTGSYRGQGHTIDQLFIDRPSTARVGFIGRVVTTASLVVDSLGLTNVNITGDSYVGGFAGQIMDGDIDACYVTGSIDGDGGDFVGGFAGQNGGDCIMDNCYSTASVDKGNRIGGFIGRNNGTINNCYSTGAVTNEGSTVGGFAAENYGTITNSFWDKENSTESTSADGSTGKTTKEMQTELTYTSAGWDFMEETANGENDYWGINPAENSGYPFLAWQGLPFCSAPDNAVTGISFGTVTGSSINLASYSEPTGGASGYVVYINDSDSFTDPVIGDDPATSTSWAGSGQQCIYNGALLSPDVTATALSANTTYYFKVYAYNDCSGTKVYESTGTVASETTLPVVSFVYHDEEGVVQTGDEVYIAGEFNSWNASANMLTDNGDGTYSASVDLADGTYEYKYVVNDGSTNQLDWLNSSNRAIEVSGSTTQNDYRNASVGFANLESPASLSTVSGAETDPVYGQLYISNVTEAGGEGRGIKAQLGYGTDADPANWTTWADMTFHTQSGNNDEFSATFTPENIGSYKYATRYDPNWGTNNPNSGWVYGDQDGNPYSSDQAGDLTVDPDTTTWNGSGWSNGTPDANTNIVLNGDFTTTATLECNDLTIEADYDFTADHAVTINGNMLLKSDATGTASLLDNGNISITSKGTAIIQQYLPDGRWWYISPQIGAASTDDLLVDQTDYRLFYWNENNSGDGWNEMSAATAMDVQTGYAYYQQSGVAVTAEFSGSFNTGSYGSSDNLTRSSGAYKEGFNLVGNPYPSAVDWGTENSPTPGLDKTNLLNTIWVRKDGSFATYNWSGDGTSQNGGSQFIAPGQAFWVRVDQAYSTGTYSLDNQTRVHATAPIMKSQEDNILRLNLSRENFSDETVIGFYGEASDSFDKYDSEKMFATDENNPELFSLNGDHQLAINGMAPMNRESVTVPLGFKTAKSGNFTIHCSNITDFIYDREVYLVDHQAGATIDLRKQPNYDFFSDAVTSLSRFSLVIRKSATSIENIATGISIYSSDNTVFVNAAKSMNATMTIYDVSGKVVSIREVTVNSGVNKYKLNHKNGVYLINIKNTDTNVTEKVIIR